MLCPKRKKSDKSPESPNEFEHISIRNDRDKFAIIRTRLSDVAWWMRLLGQNIGTRAKQEDKEVGKCFQGRYRSVRILDEATLLACAAYVDLNPIRAAIVETLEQSDSTSAQRRIQTLIVRLDKLGATPLDMPPIFDRLKLDFGNWKLVVSDFGRLFSSVAGAPKDVYEMRSLISKRRFYLKHPLQLARSIQF